MRIFALIANTAQITQELVRGFNDPRPDTLIELESCGVDDGRNLIVLNADVHNHDRGSHLHDDFKHRLNSRGLLTPDTSTDVCGVSDVEKTAHSDRGTAFSTPTEEKNDYTFLEAVFGMSLSEEDARQKEILE